MSHIAFIFNAVLGTHMLGAHFEGVVDSIDDHSIANSSPSPPPTANFTPVATQHLSFHLLAPVLYE
jgi:hypothetical protein